MQSLNLPSSAKLLHPGDVSCMRREVAGPGAGGLELLEYAALTVTPGGAARMAAYPGRESLYIVTGGSARLIAGSAAWELGKYDCAYVPCGVAHSLRSDAGAALAHFLAPSEKECAPYVVRYGEIDRAQNNPRVRKLKGKDVVILCGEQDEADKLLAGLTFFEAVTRSFPPHSHEDQEEIYLFVEGHGSMEVYADEESKSFVREVGPGDAVTIPRRTFHPVFSFGEPLVFIWVIAGKRYWVGDRNKDFMKGATAR